MYQQVEEEKNMSTSVLSSPEGGQEKKVAGGGGRRRRRRRARGEGDGGKKRRLSEEQVKFLEKSFWNERKLETGRKVHLATEAGLEPKQVAVWFQNRRAKWKSKQLQQEYDNLKSMHETAVIEKCHLQTEVLNLKQQLMEAEKEKRNLSSLLNSPSGGVGDGGSGEPSSSPSTLTYSMETNILHADQLGLNGEELGLMDGYSADQMNTFDWFSFYWF